MKIGLWGWYGFRNCGDDALLLGLLSRIETRNQDREVCVFGDKRNLERLLPGRRVRLVKRSARNLALFALCGDVLIVGPGGLFPFANTPKLAFYLALTALMRLRKKRVLYLGVGVGTPAFGGRRNVRLLNAIAENACAFVSRSRNYLDYAPALRADNITLSCDMLFADVEFLQYGREQEPDLVVMALADCFQGLPKACRERFLEEFLPFARHILRQGYRIHLIPFYNEQDQTLHDTLAAQIRDARVVSLPFRESPCETFAEISRGAFCVGMRFHSLVMALMNRIPCMSVSYSDKNEDIMQRFGLREYSVRFEPVGNRYFPRRTMIDRETLCETFDALRRNRQDIRAVIRPRLEALTRLSRKNQEILDRFLSQ